MLTGLMFAYTRHVTAGCTWILQCILGTAACIAMHMKRVPQLVHVQTASICNKQHIEEVRWQNSRCQKQKEIRCQHQVKTALANQAHSGKELLKGESGGHPLGMILLWDSGRKQESQRACKQYNPNRMLLSRMPCDICVEDNIKTHLALRLASGLFPRKAFCILIS